ncbi:MAG: hypothetical protein II723_02325 [Oscillospiraceae bacterium]|nr:hypothetical protein [Oscillospiraceae bacterium]
MSSLLCKCGFVFHDNSDAIYRKAHLISDKDWFPLPDMADSLIESPDPDRAALCMTLRHNLSGKGACVQERFLFQCPECSRVYIEAPDGTFVCFAPEDSGSDQMLFDTKGTGEVLPIKRIAPESPADQSS